MFGRLNGNEIIMESYYSQAGQDAWVVKMMGSKKGFFVDLGAYDGVQTSNTYFLEKYLGWGGICVEGNVEAFFKLCPARTCQTVNKAVTDYKGICQFGADRIGEGSIIGCDTLENILIDYVAPKTIDYLSMDIEGEELKVLKIFPFHDWDIKLITVEHNRYCDGPEKKDALFELLTRNGYERVVEDAKCLDPNPLYFNQPFEDWYQKIESYGPQNY